jgi:hypothetical protein
MHRGDLLTEQDAVVGDPSHPRFDRNVRRPNGTRGEDRNHEEMIAKRIPAVLRNDERRARLVRVVGLPGRVYEPNFAALGSGPAHSSV